MARVRLKHRVYLVARIPTAAPPPPSAPEEPMKMAYANVDEFFPVRFGVFTVVAMKDSVFWDATP